jgi:UDP-glucose 4-epimerase
VHAFVVGGAGFIGSHLVDRLLADGASVDVVDDLSRGSLANLADARSVSAGAGTLKIHHLDAKAPEAASLLGMRRPDIVYHLAAIPRGQPSAAGLADAFAVTVALIDAARLHAVPKVVVALPASSIYGRPASRDLPLKERAVEPHGVRGVVARAVIDLLTVYRERDAVEFTALALPTVYGPRQRADGGIVAVLAAAAAARRAPTITGDGRQTRDLLHVDDAVDALARAGDRGGGLVINVGTGEQTSIRELWTKLSAGAGPPPQYAPARVDEIVRFALSPARARIQLGWSPWTSVDEGLATLR